MSLRKDRQRIFTRGLGKMSVREIEPSESTIYVDIGYLGGTVLTQEFVTEDLVTEDGYVFNSLAHSENCQLTTNLQQTSIHEINLIRNADARVYSVRYDGALNPERNYYQYYCMEQAKIIANLQRNFETGLKPLSLTVKAIKKDYTLYHIPLFYLIEARRELSIDKCNLWIDAKQDLNLNTIYCLDHSGFARHGIFTQPSFWGFDTGLSLRYIAFTTAGTDYMNLGNVLNDSTGIDFGIECWLYITGANNSQQIFLHKKQVITDNTAGFALYRNATNKIVFRLSSGSGSAEIVSSNSVMQNTWTHVFVAINRNGNGQIYINGSADGSPVSVASIGSGSNSQNYIVGTSISGLNSAFRFTTLRHYIYGTGGLPLNIATIVSNHYNAERGYHGI